MAFEQARHGFLQKDSQRAIGFGEVERALEGTRGGAGIAKRVLDHRLRQEHTSPKLDLRQARGRLTWPRPPWPAVENRRQRSYGFLGFVLGEPQRRQAGAV